MKLTSMVFILILAAATAFGAEVKKDDAFWGSTQNKVQKLKLTSRKTTAASATVAGVKGAKNDRTDIYWKGKEKKIEISEDELQKFNLAMEAQGNGEKAAALKHFEAFLKEFPKSPLHAEGTQAVQLLKAELTAQPSAAVAPAPATKATVEAAPAKPTPAATATPAAAPAPTSAAPAATKAATK